MSNSCFKNKLTLELRYSGTSDFSFEVSAGMAAAWCGLARFNFRLVLELSDRAMYILDSIQRGHSLCGNTTAGSRTLCGCTKVPFEISWTHV